MADVTIVAAGAERIDELLAFWLQLHRHQGALSVPITGIPLRADHDTERLTRSLYLEWLAQPDGFAFIAEQDTRSLGYLIGVVQEPSEVWDTGRIGYIDSFFVVPEARGAGIGRLLLETAYDRLRQLGVETVGLDVIASNVAARGFYDRAGFVPTFLQMYRRLPPDPG